MTMCKNRLVIIALLMTTLISAQTINPVNNTIQLLEVNRSLNRIPQVSFNRTLMQPILVNPGFIRRTTIVVEDIPFTPALNPYTIKQNKKCRKPKVERPFVPTYIHLNLNKQ